MWLYCCSLTWKSILKNVILSLWILSHLHMYISIESLYNIFQRTPKTFETQKLRSGPGHVIFHLGIELNRRSDRWIAVVIASRLLLAYSRLSIIFNNWWFNHGPRSMYANSSNKTSFGNYGAVQNICIWMPDWNIVECRCGGITVSIHCSRIPFSDWRVNWISLNVVHGRFFIWIVFHYFELIL